jgi:hypothetical protein
VPHHKEASLYTTYFDRYQRFRAVADLLSGLERAPNGLLILDVGGFDGEFAKFLPGDRVRPWGELIRPENGPLPFKDGSFDVVVALDVLEHVIPEERPFFLAETARVASRALVLSFPVHEASEVEEFVLGLTGNPWLAEHRIFGLPRPADVEAVLDTLGLDHTRHPNASQASWMAMHLMMHRLREDLKEKVSEFFNRRYFELENREPAYRAIYFCTPARG